MSKIASVIMNFLKWSVFTLVVAAIVHIAVVQFLPNIAMSRLASRLEGDRPLNQMRYPPRPNEDARVVVRPSPDLIYSICPYDVAEGPIRLTSPVPNSYWSLSAFANDTENYLVINDKQTGNEFVDLILMAPGQVFENPDLLPTIEAKTEQGIILTRTLITSAEDFGALDAQRREAKCELFVAPEQPPEDEESDGS